MALPDDFLATAQRAKLAASAVICFVITHLGYLPANVWGNNLGSFRQVSRYSDGTMAYRTYRFLVSHQDNRKVVAGDGQNAHLRLPREHTMACPNSVFTDRQGIISTPSRE